MAATLYMSLRDQVSSALKSMANSAKAFDKNMAELDKTLSEHQQRQSALIKDAAKLRVALENANKQVNSSKDAYRKYGDELSKSVLEKAIEEQTELRERLKDTEAAMKTNRRAMKDLMELGERGGGGGDSGLLGSLKTAGLTKMLGDSVSQLVGLGAESFFGQPTASLVNSIGSGIASGFAIGSLVGHPLLGAVAGAASGALSGGAQVLAARDDAFKSYYRDTYESAGEQRAAELSAGTGIASGRETDRISFTTLFGSEATAVKYLAELVDMANTTPFLYDDLTAMSKTLATYGYGPKNILPVLQTVGDTGAALGMSTQDMTMVATALGRMKSSNKTTLEYLNILNDRGIGAVGMLAEHYGVDQGEIYSRISKGSIAGGEAVGIILAALKDSFSGAMETQSQTYGGRSSTLEGLENELQNALGDAYNATAKEGIGADIDAWGGELGDAMKAMNAAIGEGRGLAENLERQYAREAMETVLLGKNSTVYTEDQKMILVDMHQRYTDLKGRFEGAGDAEKAGIAAQIESLKSEAESFAAAAYTASDTGVALHDAELELIRAIRENTAALGSAGYLQDYEKQQEQSKGYGNTTTGEISWLEALHIAADPTYAIERGYAYGLNRVPYDGYAAVLHEGERVLTAAQARAADAGGGGGVSVTVTGNSFYVRSDADVTAVAEELARQIQLRWMGGRY